jgi:hypothetical protein
MTKVKQRRGNGNPGDGAECKGRFRIERHDGTVDGLGDAVTFGTEGEAWEAAEQAFGGDPASHGPEGVRAWLRVVPVCDDALDATATVQP